MEDIEIEDEKLACNRGKLLACIYLYHRLALAGAQNLDPKVIVFGPSFINGKF